jgi:hypothetical protein
VKITKTYLRQVIKEELSAVMAEDVVSLDAYRKEKAEQEEKEKEEKETAEAGAQAASLQKRIEDHQNLLNQFLVKGGAALLNRLAEDPGGEEDIRGHEVLQKLADFDPSQQLNWTLYNIIEAWKKRRKELLKSVLEYKAWNLRRGDKPNEDAKRLAMQEIYRILTVDDSRDRLMIPLTDAEKNDPSYGGVPPNARMLDNAEREAVKKVFYDTVKARGGEEYKYIDLYNDIMAL